MSSQLQEDDYDQDYDYDQEYDYSGEYMGYVDEYVDDEYIRDDTEEQEEVESETQEQLLQILPEPIDGQDVFVRRALVAAIVSDDPAAVGILIRQVPIDVDTIEQILDDLLVHAVNNNSIDSFKVLLKYYEDYVKTIELTDFTPRVKYVLKDLQHVIVKLSQYGLTSSMLYDFLFDVIDDLGIDTLTIDICKMKDDTSTGAIMLRVLKFYDVMTSPNADATLRRLQEIAEQYDSLIVQEVLRKYKRQMNVVLGRYAPPNDWILPVVRGNEPVLIDHVEVPLMDIDDIRQHYEDMVGKTDIAEDFNTPYDIDASSLTQLITDYQEEMSRGIFMRRINDTTVGKSLDRMLGPLHNNMRATLHDDHICMRYGGCRMLVCNCVEGNDEEFGDDDDADWFKGQCDECGLLIKNRRHAVRVPRDAGGWSGCYCSFNCLYGRLYKDSFDDEIVAEIERRIKTSMIYEYIDAAETIERRSALGISVESTVLMVDGRSDT